MPADQSPPADCIGMYNGEDGLASSSELVVRDDGEDVDVSSPLGFPPVTSLDWALFCVKDIGLVVGYEDQVVVLLTAIEEDHSRVVKGACSRDRMEL
jgi:hypothetical protein